MAATESAPTVCLTGSFRFDSTLLFSDLQFSLPGGQWSCLLGQSGIGKSTLLRLLAGLQTGGEFDGAITADGRQAMPRIAYMAQSDLLAPWLDVLENVLLGARLRRDKPDPARASELLELVGLAEHAGKRPAELSGGMRQRVALARTLMEQCPVVLLDEPFSALDAKTRADMQELSFELLQGATVLLATHDPAEAVRLGHSVHVMSHGGLSAFRLPGGVPVRAVDDIRVLEAQAGLLAVLRREHS